MVYIGIDPGVSGGIAVVTDSGQAILFAAMPVTEHDIYTLLSQIPVNRGVMDDRRAVLERVGASPQMGRVSAFTFGRSYGGLLMALTAAQIPFDLVTPQKWQQAMGCLTPKGTTAVMGKKDKNISKRRAQQLFPTGVKVTHATADALLLAEYCRRFHRGLIGGVNGKEEQKAAQGAHSVEEDDEARRLEDLEQQECDYLAEEARRSREDAAPAATARPGGQPTRSPGGRGHRPAPRTGSDLQVGDGPARESQRAGRRRS